MEEHEHEHLEETIPADMKDFPLFMPNQPNKNA